MRKSYRLALVIAFASAAMAASAQDDLFDLLEEDNKPVINYATATFKGTRIINQQSSEIAAPGVMQFTILHRFGAINEDPLYNLFGIDGASVRFSLDYSVYHWLNVGFGRSSGDKTYDGWTKVKLLRQSSGARNMPISLLYYGSMTINTQPFLDNREHYFSERMAYANQLILARKFSESFSLLLAPTVVHFNVVETREQRNTLFGLGTGMRYKLTNRMALTAEYMWQVTPHTRVAGGVETPYEPSYSIGFDIETGGHVFQLHVTNARFMSDPAWMMSNTATWMNGDVFLGFNISRVFTLVKPKQPDAPSW